MLNIPKISPSSLEPLAIEKAMEKIESEPISNNNWAKEFPYTPKVSFKIAHDGTNVFLQFSVNEKEVLAAAKGNNSAVWTDSCVEFFISFDDKGYYYNLEQSCIGQVLLGYQKDRTGALRASDDILDSIKRYPSLGYNNFELKSGNFDWTLLSIIPIKTFWKNNLQALDGVKAKANFYKCGDNLATPHFLSWAPISSEKPNFHQVSFFKDIVFGS